MTQERIKKQPQRKKEEVVEEETRPARSAEETKQALDDLLDEIDEVLEENGIKTNEEAAAFVRGYTQKGGQ